MKMKEGGQGASPGTQILSNFMQFLGKFGKIICWRPLFEEILDPPLDRVRPLDPQMAFLSFFASLQTCRLSLNNIFVVKSISKIV